MNFKYLITKVLIIFVTTIGILYTTVAFSDTGAPDIKKSPVLEVVIFQTSKDVSPKKVIQASKKVTKVLESYAGFIERTFSQDSNVPNQWIDIVEWQNIDYSMIASEKMINNKDIESFMDLMKNGYTSYNFDVKFQDNEQN